MKKRREERKGVGRNEGKGRMKENTKREKKFQSLN